MVRELLRSFYLLKIGISFLVQPGSFSISTSYSQIMGTPAVPHRALHLGFSSASCCSSEMMSRPHARVAMSSRWHQIRKNTEATAHAPLQLSDGTELAVMLSIVVGSIILSPALGYRQRDATMYCEDRVVHVLTGAAC